TKNVTDWKSVHTSLETTLQIVCQSAVTSRAVAYLTCTSVARHGKVPVVLHGENSESETESRARQRCGFGRQLQHVCDHDGGRTEQSGHGVQLRSQHSGNLGQQNIPGHAAADPGHHAEQRSHHWIQPI